MKRVIRITFDLADKQDNLLYSGLKKYHAEVDIKEMLWRLVGFEAEYSGYLDENWELTEKGREQIKENNLLKIAKRTEVDF